MVADTPREKRPSTSCAPRDSCYQLYGLLSRRMQARLQRRPSGQDKETLEIVSQITGARHSRLPGRRGPCGVEDPDKDFVLKFQQDPENTKLPQMAEIVTQMLDAVDKGAQQKARQLLQEHCEEYTF
ncbi:hypothetical protein HIM_02470 [Hirsutella minnesotensis 3608]|nr:hypothetical protein HIM_02470 [Hirsutella minnesotensis 3608]